MKHIKLFEGFINEANVKMPKKYGIAVFSRDYKEKPSSNNRLVNPILKKYPGFSVITDDYEIDDSILTVVTNYKKTDEIPNLEQLWSKSYDTEDPHSIIWFNDIKELGGRRESKEKMELRLGAELSKKEKDWVQNVLKIKKGDILKFTGAKPGPFATFEPNYQVGGKTMNYCIFLKAEKGDPDANVEGTLGAFELKDLKMVNGKSVKYPFAKELKALMELIKFT